jgi:Protein of unknown function (DUF2917)
MTPAPESTNPVRLVEGQLLRFSPACDTRVECHGGTLWITIDNDPRDVVLEAGQTTTLSADARAIAQPILGPAVLSVAPEAAPCAPAARRGAAPWRRALHSAWGWNTAGVR